MRPGTSIHHFRLGLALLALLLSRATLAAPTGCEDFEVWPKGSRPTNFHGLLDQIQTEFGSVLSHDEAELKVAQAAVDRILEAGTQVSVKGYLRAFTRLLQLASLEYIKAIEEIKDINDRRARAYQAWEEMRIGYTILAVYMRKLLYDRDFRDKIMESHGQAQQDLAEQLVFVRTLRRQLDIAKTALLKDTKSLPTTHPFYTLDPQALGTRISWSATTLLESEAKLPSLAARIVGTEYPEVVYRYRAAQERHRIALQRLWKILQATTWPSSRWTFRMTVMAEVMRLRYANANFVIKMLLPTVVLISSSTAVFGDWMHLGAAYQAIMQHFFTSTR